jgi:hypothetical protein
MDTSDEEEIQAESQQTPEQIAAGLGAKKKEQERLRNLVAQKQQTIKFASVKQSTSKLATKHKSGGEEREKRRKKGGKNLFWGVYLPSKQAQKIFSACGGAKTRGLRPLHIFLHIVRWHAGVFR